MGLGDLLNKDNLSKIAGAAKGALGDKADIGDLVSKVAGNKDILEKLGSDDIMSAVSTIGKLIKKPADSNETQTAVGGLQKVISDKLFNCPNDLFSKIGGLFSSEKNLREKINSLCGDGVAEYVSKAIGIFCKK